MGSASGDDGTASSASGSSRATLVSLAGIVVLSALVGAAGFVRHRAAAHRAEAREMVSRVLAAAVGAWAGGRRARRADAFEPCRRS